MPQPSAPPLCCCSYVLSSLQIIGVFRQGQLLQRSSFLSCCLAVCAQPRPPPNVRAAQPMVPYTTLPHPPYYPLNGRVGREKFWGRAAGRWPILRGKKKKMMTGGGRETWGQHLRAALADPPLRSLISPASSHIKVTPGCIISASHFHSDYTGNVFIQDGNRRALLARIIMLIEITHLWPAKILCKLTFSLSAFVSIRKRFLRIKFNHLQRPSRGQ